MSLSAHEATRPDRQRYFDHIAAERGPVAEIEPVCLYLETTNRCNLLCTTCPRTFEALDLSGNDQVAFYDDGVGTSSFKPMAILGGAFGLGLRRNVIALYKFACRNYRDADDELFGFGFSRGAFTIRIVMGLIDSQGFLPSLLRPR